MHAAANTFLLVYAGLFPIVNPVGGAPIFLALTSGQSAEVRRSLAWRVAVNGFILMLGSLFVGSHVLVFFGITLPVVRIAGGLAVASFGWRLLRDGAAAADDRNEAHQSTTVDAFYPLTMPLTVGPGSISVAITIGSHGMRKVSATIAPCIASVTTSFACEKCSITVATGHLGSTKVMPAARATRSQRPRVME